MAHKIYFEALARLEANNPINVPKGTKISNDAVSLEAGRKKGSIKIGRKSFAPLIEAINRAKLRQSHPMENAKISIAKQKARAIGYKEKYHSSLNREVNYLYKIAQLKEKAKN